ncbi:MAG: hypothetical protein JWM05_2275, partial [Acidimicrobiales bacterium]|nr:hypothetical protein [Acidimicrobiales bacterium]
MGLLTVILVLGSVVRLALLFLRPSAKVRFRHSRRRLLATRVEQGGDVLLLVTAAGMVLFGYRNHPSAVLVGLWLLSLLAGIAMVALAHDVARRHRPHAPGGAAEAPPPAPPA